MFDSPASRDSALRVRLSTLRVVATWDAETVGAALFNLARMNLDTSARNKGRWSETGDRYAIREF